MTFLWKKKSRVARISQRFMSDLHSPSKNCRSLALETGFPPSLVDLIVKNKNRLKKLSSKRTQDDNDQDWEISDPLLTSPLPPHLVGPEACADLVEFEPRVSGYSRGEIEGVEEVRESEIVHATKTREDHVVSGKNVMFVNVLKALVVVVLGLSTRKSVAAVVMSVVLLLLLELIRKQLIRSSATCLDAWAHCRGITNRVHQFLGIKCLFRNKSKARGAFDVVISEGGNVAERSVDCADRSLTDKIGEIDGAVFIDDELVVTAYSSSVGEGSLDSGIKTRNTEFRRYERFGFSGQEDHKHGRDVKPKSKFMKMIVPKKLKNPKTGKRNMVSGAILLEAERLSKEHHGQVKEVEVQLLLAKEQFENGDEKKMNKNEITNEDNRGS